MGSKRNINTRDSRSVWGDAHLPERLGRGSRPGFWLTCARRSGASTFNSKVGDAHPTCRATLPGRLANPGGLGRSPPRSHRADHQATWFVQLTTFCMRVDGNFAVFQEMRPAVMVVSHERSGTHFLMNALASCYGYVSAPWVDFDRPTFNINYFYLPEVQDLLLALADR